MQARRYRTALLACTALAVLSLSTEALAQDVATAATTTGKSTNLQAVVVKGRRVGKIGTVADTPLASTTTAEQIRNKEISSARDLGNSTEPGVDYADSRPGRTGGLFIRGLGGPRIVTLVDGIPISSFGNLVRSGNTSPTTGFNEAANAFDFSSLSTVDVLRGADSSRLGSGALGGALVLRTLEPEDLIEEGRDWGGIAKLGFDSTDRSVGGSVAVAKRFNDTSVLFQGAYKRGHERDNKGTVDTIGLARTTPDPTDFDQKNVLFKVRHNLDGGHRIGVTAERYDLDNDFELKTMQSAVPLSNGFIPIVTYLPNKGWGFEGTHRDRVSLDYNYEAPSEDAVIDAATLTLYWQKLGKEAGSDGIRTSNGLRYYRNNSVEERSVGLTGNLLSEFDTGYLTHEVRLGGTFQIFDTEQYLEGFPASSVVNKADTPHVDGKRLGLSLEDRIGFGDSGFALTPGVRFDWYDYDPKSAPGYTGTVTSRDGSRFSPKLLATYQLTPETELFAQWSMSYRAPTADELYIHYIGTGGPGYLVRGNASLKDETGQGFEVGANYESGDVSGKLTLFHNKYDNFIEFHEVSAAPSVSSWRNIESVAISGAELKGRKEFDNGFFLSGSLAYAYGKNETANTYLRSVAPFKGILGVGYEQETWGTELTGVFSAGMRDDHKATTFDAPGYGVFNLAGWWEPEQMEGLRVQAGIYNIFDRKHWNAVGVRDVNPIAQNAGNQPVDFYSEPGRSFKISLTKRF
jgi:hemoglobin/transferrin/lactoferrin receptor protein